MFAARMYQSLVKTLIHLQRSLTTVRPLPEGESP